MAIETEFKFLVNKLPVKHIKSEPYEIVQIYFDGSRRLDLLNGFFPEVDLRTIHTFRIRIINYMGTTKYLLTLKTSGDISREEYEKEIDKNEADMLYEDNIETAIVKNRYRVEYHSYVFEFDEYMNLKRPMITVEVEIENKDIEKKRQEIIAVIRNVFELKYEDVSSDYHYRNSNLIKFFG